MALLSIQVLAFGAFHLSHGLIFEIEFVKLILIHGWITPLNYLFNQLALFGPIAVFGWMLRERRHNKILLISMACATFFSAYFWQYPALTGFLYALGQVDSYGMFLFANMPSIAEYPPI